MDKFFRVIEAPVISASDVEAATAEQPVSTEIEVLKPGVWDAPNHGKFSVSEDDLEEYIQNFKAGVRAGVPIDIEHDTKGGAVGWIKDLYKSSTGTLMASVEWTRAGASLLSDKAYKFFSPEFQPSGYQDPEGKGAFKNVLLGGAVTNRPLFKSLKPIAANEEGDPSTSGLTGERAANIIYTEEEDKSVQLDEIRKLDPSAVTEEQRSFLTEHKAELSEDEVSKFGLGEAAKSEVTLPAAAAVAADDKTKEEAVKASDKGVVISASELDALTKKANDGAVALVKLERKEASDFVQGHVARGAIKADQAEEAVSILMAADGTAREQLEKFYNGLPENKLVTAGEKGEDEKGVIGSAGESLDAKATEIMKANDGLSYADALKQAAREIENGSKQYDSELAERGAR